MKKFVAGTVAFVFLSLILWFFWGWGAAIFIVLAMLTLGLAFRYMPGYRVYFAFLIIGSILAMIVVPTVRHFIAQEFPQFRIANDRSLLELDHKLSKLTDSSMVYSKTAMRSYLGSLDGILKRQLDQQLEVLLQKKENGTFGPLEAVELAQIIHRINVWGMIYEANQEAVDKGKMPTNMLTVAVRVGQYDVPLYGGDGREIIIENGNSDQTNNGKIRAGAVVKIVIPEMVRQFVGQPEANPLQQWVVSSVLSKQFQPGEVFAIVYLDDANGLPTANFKRCGWLPLSAFEAVVNPYDMPKRAVQNDPSGDDPSGGWQASVKNSLAAGDKIRWWPFVFLAGLIVAGWLACKKWVKNKTILAACPWVVGLLLLCIAYGFLISPFVYALANEVEQKAPTPPKLISQSNQGGDMVRYAPEPNQQPEHGGQIILTSSQELVDGLELKDDAGVSISGPCQIYWHEGGTIWNWNERRGKWSWILPYGNYYLDETGRLARFPGNGQFQYLDLPAYCVVVKTTGGVKYRSWPKSGQVGIPEGVTKVVVTVNTPVHSERWGQESGSIVLEVVK